MDERASVGLRRAAHAIILVWAVGIVLREPITQAGAYAAIALGLYLWIAKKVEVPRELWPFVLSAAAYCGWQVVSTPLSLSTGASAHWPPFARFGQAVEPLAVAALAIVAQLGVPWVKLGWTLAVGWLASCAVAVYQHLFGWPFDFPAWMKLSTQRVRENFATGGAPRYGAGGFQFHRLRFGHAAIALLGPALAAAVRLGEKKARILAGVVVAALLGGIWMTFARAAFGAALIVVAAGFVLFTRGWVRRGGLILAAALVLGAVASPAWRDRFARAGANVLEGERMQAMTAGMRMFREHPLFGVGFGNHREHARALAPELHMPDHITWDSHDIWITAMAETGLVGLLLMLAFHGTLAVALYRRFKAGAWIAGGALLSWVGFLVLGGVHYLPFHSSVALTFYFVWGLGLVAPIEARDP
ncbi:MAG: O-antigen ligase family protein [Myxococcaceae bacterium]|nr:O-antigen ligase family protein [Myxococcaceae bacterium]